MAQRDKVKELVGRGLNSYHTKSLQQMDRIEKKNKEQNHKISILSNELDNDYLTKTEEGSVISLEHSKEGMVYLDELQGNTLVNYCSDGSKELTLNGDIDVEGTFVTTTEGVDNGKVDVMCEGNTLVNLGGKVNKQIHRYGLLLSSTRILNPSTLYTFIVTNLGNQSVQFYRNESVFNATSDRSKVVPANSTIVFTWETLSNLTDNGLIKSEMDGATQFTLDVVLLEGDWTNREIPQYFEGMKSVGQDDINGHKIEILSNNKNLLNLSNVTRNAWGVTVTYNQGVLNINGTLSNEKDDGLCDYYLCGSWTGEDDNLKLKPNTKYTFSGNVPNYVEIYIIHNAKVLCQLNGAYNNNSFTNSSHGRINAIMVRVKKGFTFSNTTINIQIEEGSTSTSFIAPNLNKKEILLNEPLRGLPNGVKDKKVKIGNKWYIERNCEEIILDGSNMNNIENTANPTDTSLIRFQYTSSKIKNGYRNVISDLLPQNTTDNFAYVNREGVDVHPSSPMIAMWLKRDRLQSENLEGFKQWLTTNPMTLVYALATPIYEPLEVEPTLNTYNDITHISNNSIIPCNMKIQNSGYNAIIKPSTLYTVALDTNKSGTIGMNLGGMKTVTTNNVATITTPAILSDDSLRLFGKGIKGSKVRLLEGDKTNWIPSHFEGMKSSFEDKLQEDGTYKMEILSNNENLIDIVNNSWETIGSVGLIEKIGSDITFDCNGSTTGGYGVKMSEFMYLKPNTQYVLNANWEILRGTTDLENPYLRIFSPMTNTFFGTRSFNGLKFTTDATGIVKPMLYIDTPSIHDIKVKFTNIQLKEVGNVNYIPHKSNKIQFSSIEPLRSTENAKDKFVFKDNKLLIERNVGVINFKDLNGWYISGDNKNYTDIRKGFGRFITNGAYYTRFSNYATQNNLNLIWKTLNQAMLFSHATQNEIITVQPPNTTLEQFLERINLKDEIMLYNLLEPTYEEIPFELQKIILEGYENGTLFIDTNIPPTSTITYAGETPIVKSVKLNKTEVLNNTNDINDNIIPYLMDMDYRVVCLQLATEEIEGGVSMARLFGGAYEMLKRDILSKRLSRQEYGYRLADYFNAGKLTEEQVRELEDLR